MANQADRVEQALQVGREARARLEAIVGEEPGAARGLLRALGSPAGQELDGYDLVAPMLVRLAAQDPSHGDLSPGRQALRALEASDLAAAEAAAMEVLEHVRQLPPEAAPVACRQLHRAHTVLGIVRLQRGDLTGAAEHLRASLDLEDDSMLRATGPDVSLAFRLLGTEQEPAAVEFLRRCAAIWQPRTS